MAGDALIRELASSAGWTALFLAARIVPLVVVLPFFGGLASTPMVRSCAGIALLIGLWPQSSIDAPADRLTGVEVLCCQAAVGFLTSLGLLGVTEAARTIGSVLDTALGRGSFGASDPLGSGATGPVSTLYALGFVAVFMASGAHVALIEGVSLSTAIFPLDGVVRIDDLRELAMTSVSLLAAAFAAAVALALPALGVGLVVDISLGWLGRTMPQLPVLFVSMPLRMLLGWTVIAATLAGALGWMVRAVGDALASLSGALQ